MNVDKKTHKRRKLLVQLLNEVCSDNNLDIGGIMPIDMINDISSSNTQSLVGSDISDIFGYVFGSNDILIVLATDECYYSFYIDSFVKNNNRLNILGASTISDMEITAEMVHNYAVVVIDYIQQNYTKIQEKVVEVIDNRVTNNSIDFGLLVCLDDRVYNVDTNNSFNEINNDKVRH